MIVQLKLTDSKVLRKLETEAMPILENQYLLDDALNGKTSELVTKDQLRGLLRILVRAQAEEEQEMTDMDREILEVISTLVELKEWFMDHSPANAQNANLVDALCLSIQLLCVAQFGELDE